MFSAMILRGLLADNGIEVILSRALVGLFGGVVLGAMLGWAGMIVVMDKGRIVQRGTHKELLRHGGLYRQIYDLQLKGHEKFAEEMEELGQKEFAEPRRRSEELR